MRWAVALAVLAAATSAGADPPSGRSVVVVHEPPEAFPTVGPRYAPVTVEFFADFGDGRVSSKIYQRLVELAQRHPRRMRVVFYVGSSRTSPDALDLNEAAYEAFAQGKFSRFAREAFAHGARPNIRFLDAYAHAAGLDQRKLQAALADDRHRDRIRAANALRTRRGSTLDSHRLVFNGVLVTQSLSTIAEFEEVYDEAYARARKLLEAGIALEELHERLLRQERSAQRPPPFPAGKVDESAVGEPPPLDPPRLVGGALDLDAHPSLGAVDARVVVALFCNLSSHTCTQQWPKVQRLIEVYPDDVRLVLWPLYDADVHPQAARAHEAALCAGDQGRLWPFVDAAYHHRRHGLDDAGLRERALGLDLDLIAFDDCLSAGAHLERVRAASAAARAAGIRHTPSLIVGARLYVGFRTDQDLRAMVELELRPGLLERAEDLRIQILEKLAPLAPKPAPAVP